MCEIAFLAVLNFSPGQKLIFGLFKIAKNGLWSKKIREINLFDFTSFLGLYFFRFSVPLWGGIFLFMVLGVLICTADQKI